MAVAEKRDRSGIDREGPLPHKGELYSRHFTRRSRSIQSEAPPTKRNRVDGTATGNPSTPQQDAQQEAPSQSGTSAYPAPARRSARVSRSRRSRSGDTDNFHRKTTALRWSHSRSRKPREPRARTNARESAGTRRRHRCRRPQDSCRGEHDSAEPDTTESTGTELAGTGSIGRDKKGRVCFT